VDDRSKDEVGEKKTHRGENPSLVFVPNKGKKEKKRRWVLARAKSSFRFGLPEIRVGGGETVSGKGGRPSRSVGCGYEKESKESREGKVRNFFSPLALGLNLRSKKIREGWKHGPRAAGRIRHPTTKE